jgi:hypothetical protein
MTMSRFNSWFMKKYTEIHTVERQKVRKKLRTSWNEVVNNIKNNTWNHDMTLGSSCPGYLDVELRIHRRRFCKQYSKILLVTLFTTHYYLLFECVWKSMFGAGATVQGTSSFWLSRSRSGYSTTALNFPDVQHKQNLTKLHNLNYSIRNQN